MSQHLCRSLCLWLGFLYFKPLFWKPMKLLATDKYTMQAVSEKLNNQNILRILTSQRYGGNLGKLILINKHFQLLNIKILLASKKCWICILWTLICVGYVALAATIDIWVTTYTEVVASPKCWPIWIVTVDSILVWRTLEFNLCWCKPWWVDNAE